MVEFADRTKWNLRANRLSQALAQHQAGTRPLLDLTASNPTECGFAYDSDAILRPLANPAALAYKPDSCGLDIARWAVAGYYAARETAVAPDDIILTTSTSEAYSFAFRLLCNPGDELLIPAPSYPLLDFLAGIQDTKLVRYPLLYDNGWQTDFYALEQAISPRTRGVIVVHPNNPTGHFTKDGERKKLNEICSARGVAIIADEVFLDFSLAEEKASSFAANPEALTFALSGLSKISGLPQMKLAWLVASGPQEVKTQALARLEIISDAYLSLNAPVQLAAPAFLRERHPFQRQLMARVRKNLAELDRQLAGQAAARRLKVEGGWYGVLHVPATQTDEELAIALLETKDVYVHPGHLYDFPAEGYLVVSLITTEGNFSEGMKRLLSFL